MTGAPLLLPLLLPLPRERLARDGQFHDITAVYKKSPKQAPFHRFSRLSGPSELRSGGTGPPEHRAQRSL